MLKQIVDIWGNGGDISIKRLNDQVSVIDNVIRSASDIPLLSSVDSPVRTALDNAVNSLSNVAGDSTAPCLTPFLIENESDKLFFHLTFCLLFTVHDN